MGNVGHGRSPLPRRTAVCVGDAEQLGLILSALLAALEEVRVIEPGYDHASWTRFGLPHRQERRWSCSLQEACFCTAMPGGDFVRLRDVHHMMDHGCGLLPASFAVQSFRIKKLPCKLCVRRTPIAVHAGGLLKVCALRPTPSTRFPRNRTSHSLLAASSEQTFLSCALWRARRGTRNRQLRRLGRSTSLRGVREM